MIKLSSSFGEIISQKENKHYKSIIKNFIYTGKINEKYMMLFSSEDIANIVILSLLYLREYMNTDNFSEDLWLEEHKIVTDKPPFYKKEIRKKEHPFKNEINFARPNIGQLYSTLPFEVKKAMLFSFGIELIVRFNLDEISGFKEVIQEISAANNHQPIPAAQRTTLKNVNK